MIGNLLDPLFLCGLTSNLTALYLVVTKSRKELSEYKKLLIIFLISDLFYTVLQDLFQPVFAVHDDLFIVFLPGPIQNKIFLSIYCGNVSLSFVIFALHFMYRAVSIKSATALKAKRLSLIIIALLSEVITWIVVCQVLIIYEPGYESITREFYSTNNITFPSNPYDSVLIFKSFLSIPCFLLYFPCAFYLLIPFVKSSGVRTPLRLLTLLYSIYPILDPLAIIFMISDYRQAVINFFRWMTFRVGPADGISTVSETSRREPTMKANSPSPNPPPMFALFENGFIYYGYGCLFGTGMMARNSIVLFSTTFYLPFFLIAIHFLYRYLSLARPSLVKENFHHFFIFFVVYATLYHMFTAYLSNGVVTLGISQRFQGYLAEYEHRPIKSTVNVGAVEYIDENSNVNYKAIFIILAAGSVGGHANLISAVCIYKIIGIFRQQRAINIVARRVHIQLFRALLLQLSIPFFFSFLPFSAIVALPVFGIPVGDTGDLCALLISLFPALDPILIILSVSRFRLTLVQWMDVMFDNTARRNEKNALEQSRIQYSIISRRYLHQSS